MTAPIALVVTRWRCPFCPRSLSSKPRMVEHISKCWRNPAVRGCKTCKHFDPYNMLADTEGCSLGVDLTGQKACERCNGMGYVGALGQVCPECDNSPEAAERKPGPIVNCDLWELGI